MSTVFDVAESILSKTGLITVMKLQKLVYYCQAWSLVWDEKPLFKSRIEAWANGPVIPRLYQAHKGMFSVKSGTFHGDPNNFTPEEKKTISAVVKFYGRRTSQYLSELTHKEKPWKDARKGMTPDQRGTVEITHAALSEYYNSLL
ncbi:MAG: DUF4065 domain-containing protein [Kiritimatiellae bacterium]|nr:DUF4065 domain-containing protein [Kiritimatiellia bacterium]MDD5521842.1 DUF4065 domain-containing protein [Kiritimatiellia bacterium]